MIDVRYEASPQHSAREDISVRTYNGTLSFMEGQPSVRGRISSFINREDEVPAEWVMNSPKNFVNTGNSQMTSAFRVLTESDTFMVK